LGQIEKFNQFGVKSTIEECKMGTFFEKKTRVLLRGSNFGSSNQRKYGVQFRSMAMVSTEELFKALNEDRTKPKKKALIRNEIVKRGIRIVRK
jgi:hypothetical protein|tara:strand:+ start:156 stop:434 length:279 start_codon:yes stop_codon:yes gene_type:complete